MRSCATSVLPDSRLVRIEGWRNLCRLGSVPFEVFRTGKQNLMLRRVGMGCSCIHRAPFLPCIASVLPLLSAWDPDRSHIPASVSLPRLGGTHFAAHHFSYHLNGGTTSRPPSHLPRASPSPPCTAVLPRPFPPEPRDSQFSRWE